MTYRPCAARRLALAQHRLVVTKLERPARSSQDLHNIIGELKDRGCGFVSLGKTHPSRPIPIVV